MDGICLKAGLLAAPSALSISGTLDVRKNPSRVSALGRSATTVNPISTEKPSSFSLGNPWKFVWGRGKQNSSVIEDLALVEEERKDEDNEDKENWILKILRVNYRWTKKENCGLVDLRKEDGNGGVSDNEDEEREVSRVYEDEEKNKHSFSKLLRKVTLAEAKLYAQMSHLGSLAYKIPKIKAENLMKYSGLRFVTSSKEVVTEVEEDEADKPKPNAPRISASSAYRVVASAASYLQSHAKGIIPFNFHRDDFALEKMNREMASLVATADSVTAVVAAEEEVRQAVANDLKSTRSSPCEWFICDEDPSGTRFFVIQGSESLASWQANLLFEPIRFEELEFLVHRGIYELAKRIYEQMLPEVRSHLKIWKDRASFRFTGHSLGGSLALLVSLMLVTRGEVPPCSLLPVITFGSPTVMCGGNRLLRQLGLPRNHLQSITMHRDIVPRAFSCNYPAHVAHLLRALNKNFRNHPCLNNQKLLYSPMGELLILQPDEEFSPNHHLLPPGSGLYILSCPHSGEEDDDLVAAQRSFLNSPHPLEILSDRSAYGSDGSIHKHHDLNFYIKSVRTVICQELNRIRKAERERRRKVWWPLVLQRGATGGRHVGGEESSVSFVMQLGRKSVKRFVSLFASRQMNLLVVFLFPAPFLVFGPFGGIRIR